MSSKHDEAVELIRRELDPAEYAEIRELWKRHSIAEDNRDLAGLVSTLTDDCVYELVQTGERWEGHHGAGRFYTELLTAFPDIHFDLTSIVIGPQGVYEEADVTATRDGELLAWKVGILFPWDPDARRFKGERVWADAPALLSRRRTQ